MLDIVICPDQYCNITSQEMRYAHFPTQDTAREVIIVTADGGDQGLPDPRVEIETRTVNYHQSVIKFA